MEKLYLTKYETFEVFDSILNSNRHYQNITFLATFSDLKKNPKSLRVLRAIVEKFSTSLLCLKISHDLKLKVDLPKLKELQFQMWDYELNTVSLIVSNGLITKAKNLKKLLIRYQKLDNKSLKYLKDALKENESLKIMKIFTVNIIKELNQDDMKLKLEEFYFHQFHIGNKKVIQDFLGTQATSLQVAECAFNKEFITYFMSSLPKLHTLVFTSDICNRFYRIMRSEEPSYPLNETITKLIFKMDLYTDENHFLHASAIINKLPNLREIQMSYLNPLMLPLFNNCPSLKVVKFNFLKYNFSQIQRDQMAQNERIKFIQIRR
jgi:hypothetical protein